MGSKSSSSAYYIRLLEAILFIAERPVSSAEIKQKLNIQDDQELNRLLAILKENLEKRKSFIEIVELDQGQSLQMRLMPDIKKELDGFRTKKALSKELMATLAYIALKQPLRYSDLRILRGAKVKDHIEALEKEGFINVDSTGKAKVLTTTSYFASVFNLDPTNLKEKFKEELKKRMTSLIE